jgi:hypothetical protein
MGFESCVLINHDLYHNMADKPAQFVRDLWHAINARGNPTRFSMGTVIYTDHSAGTHLVATGGHLGADLALVSDRNPLNADVQLELLKLAADKLGYKLEPKRKPTKKAATKKVAKKKPAKKASSSRKDTDGKTPAKGHKRTRKGTAGG